MDIFQINDPVQFVDGQGEVALRGYIKRIILDDGKTFRHRAWINVTRRREQSYLHGSVKLYAATHHVMDPDTRWIRIWRAERGKFKPLGPLRMLRGEWE